MYASLSDQGWICITFGIQPKAIELRAFGSNGLDILLAHQRGICRCKVFTQEVQVHVPLVRCSHGTWSVALNKRFHVMYIHRDYKLSYTSCRGRLSLSETNHLHKASPRLMESSGLSLLISSLNLLIHLRMMKDDCDKVSISLLFGTLSTQSNFAVRMPANVTLSKSCWRPACLHCFQITPILPNLFAKFKHFYHRTLEGGISKHSLKLDYLRQVIEKHFEVQTLFSVFPTIQNLATKWRYVKCLSLVTYSSKITLPSSRAVCQTTLPPPAFIEPSIAMAMSPTRRMTIWIASVHTTALMPP